MVADDEWESVAPWLQTSCAHPDQEVAYEWLANARGMAEFRRWVRELGRHPTLIRTVPTMNGGCIPSSDVEEALRELDDFRTAAADIARCLMVDSDTGAVIRETTERGPALFALGHGDQIGFDVEGFWVAREADFGLMPVEVQQVSLRVSVMPMPPDKPSARALDEVFRARRVEQTLLSKEIVPLGGVAAALAIADRRPTSLPRRRFRFVDLDTGASIETPLGVTRDGSGEIVARFHVEAAPGLATQFDYVIEPLRRLLLAAIENRSSVRWI